jgi:murein DD-endopeptidase MepM/ murein hydrolase activator NlpD
MDKKGKHRHYYRVLVIPDDKDEPKAFNISLQRLRLIKVLAVVLALHIIGGLVFYFQYYRLTKKHATLVAVNQQLEENNVRINKLMSDFQNLEAHQEKIRKALGYGNLSGNRATPEIIIPEETAAVSYTPAYEDSRSERQSDAAQQIRERHNFLKSSTSTLHDYYTNVPTFLPVDGILSTDYENNTYAGPLQHRGIDIAADKGKVIHAAADGVVIFSDWTYDLGNLMIIYHGGGFYTYYGHAEQLLMPRGSMVKKGEVIGLLGNTGISSAPHLHFEIWKDGVSLDPKDYILEFSQL